MCNADRVSALCVKLRGFGPVFDACRVLALCVMLIAFLPSV